MIQTFEMADKSLVLARPYIPKAELQVGDAGIAGAEPLGAEAAVEQLVQRLQGPPLACVMFFGASELSTQHVAEILHTAFDCPVLGCLSDDQIGLRYRTQSLVGIGLPASLFTVHALVEVAAGQEYWPESVPIQNAIAGGRRCIGFLLHDNLFAQQNDMDAMRRRCPEEVDLLLLRAGGSGVPGIYCNGAFHSNSARLIVLESRLPHARFSIPRHDAGDDALPSLDVVSAAIDGVRNGTPDILFTMGFESRGQREWVEKAAFQTQIERLLAPLNVAGYTMPRVDNSTENPNAEASFSGIVFGAG